MAGDLSFGSDSDEEFVHIRDEPKYFERRHTPDIPVERLGAHSPLTFFEQFYAKLDKQLEAERSKSKSPAEFETSTTITLPPKPSETKSAATSSSSCKPRTSTPTKINKKPQEKKSIREEAQIINLPVIAAVAEVEPSGRYLKRTLSDYDDDDDPENDNENLSKKLKQIQETSTKQLPPPPPEKELHVPVPADFPNSVHDAARVQRVENMLGTGAKPKIKFELGECKRAFRNAIICKTLIPTEQTPSLIDLLEALKPFLEADFRALVQEHYSLKGWVALTIEYECPTSDDIIDRVIETPNMFILNEFEIPDKIDWFLNYIYGRNAESVQFHSNLTYLRTKSITVKAVRWQINPSANRN